MKTLTAIFIISMFCANTIISQTQIDSAKIIFEATNGEFKNTSGLYNPDCGGDYTAQLLDLNKDGQPEVLVQVGQGCLTGIAGNHMELYIKDKNEKWNTQFGFDGFPNILETTNLGYPDIEIAGPGFCFPVWRWNGEKYDLFKKCPEKF
ncbi:MAG: hypothetical protein IPM96_21165 [Ignavibacteria bacterium]|nr:hypothetical protein [Ignavibacteria bacterium]